MWDNKKITIGILELALVALTLFVPLETKAEYPCSILNNPKGQMEQKLIVTVAEESFGKATTDAQNDNLDSAVIQCFRKTVCKLDQNKKINCEEVQYVDECKPDQTPGAEGQPNESETYCQRVQAFIAKSGAGILYAYIGQIYRWAASLIGIVCVLYIIVGGIQIATSGDNSEGLSQAKERIVQSISGLVLLFLSAVILYTINPNFFTIS